MTTADSGTENDAGLVAAVTEGHKDAFALLVGRYRPMVLALARRLLGDDVLASDVVQEATVAALVGLDRLRSPERFGAWYAGIALNIGRRCLREVAAWPLPDDRPDSIPWNIGVDFPPLAGKHLVGGYWVIPIAVICGLGILVGTHRGATRYLNWWRNRRVS